MAPVASLSTHRYQSGSCLLEITTAASLISRWSDRPIVSSLRFTLWCDQQKLCSGGRQQLQILSAAVESYVQKHLGRYSWPNTHRLPVSRQPLSLSTIQLYELTEVLHDWNQDFRLLPSRALPVRQWGTAAGLILALGGIATQLPQWRPTPTAERQLESTAEGQSMPEIAASEPADPQARLGSQPLAAALTIESTDAAYPLRYQVKITASGDVVSVRGLNENAQKALDLLLNRRVPPPSAPLSLELIYGQPGEPDIQILSPDAGGAGSGP